MALIGRRLPYLGGPVLLRPLAPPPPPPPSPLQPPTTKTRRPFTQRHPLLLYTRSSSLRPQLPYLSQPSRAAAAAAAALPRGPAYQRQIARLLTTENRRYVTEQVWLATKWTALGWTMLLLLATAYYGWLQELIEREHPSPEEWSYFTRTHFRHAHAMLDPDFDGSGLVDWAKVGSEFRICLQRLEDPTGDGQGLLPARLPPAHGHAPAAAAATAAAPAAAAALDPTAYDVSSKSYPWRAGYFQVLMGCARAAEFLDGQVRDRTRQIVFPSNVVIGPSNPNPRPCPPGAATAPLEENCERAYHSPDTFYIKVLTGLGFSTRQRIEAALAYANWLEFKQLHHTAEEMYRWALDIAASAIPDSDSVLDPATAIINVSPPSSSGPTASYPSSNLLHTATALATHHARTGNVTAALPIYLSVLRARRSAPVDTTALLPSDQKSKPHSIHAGTDYGRAFSLLKGMIRSSAYPAEPPSGDDPFLRDPLTETKDCDEAELMLYIGEILFATAADRNPEDGLSWTKQAVAIAEKAAADPEFSAQQRSTCHSCLETGLNNWAAMVNQLLKAEKDRQANKIVPTKSWSSWFSPRAKQGQQDTPSRWEKEAEDVERLRMNLIHQGINDRMASAGGAPGSVWVG